MSEAESILRSHGIQPTSQRLAVAECVLSTDSHPTAEEVFATVRGWHPTISRATVYNTLNLFLEHQLLRIQVLREGSVVFDSNVRAHHHFVDEETGKVYDIPWSAIRVSGHRSLEEFDVEQFQVVMRGRKKKRK